MKLPKELEYQPRDFTIPFIKDVETNQTAREMIAYQANKLLAERWEKYLKEKGEVVDFGEIEGGIWGWHEPEVLEGEPEHTAYLIGIEEL